VSVIDWKDRGVFVYTAWSLYMKILIYFATLENTHLTTYCHNPIGPSLNYTAVLTSDLSYLVAFKRLLIADSTLFYPWPTVYKCCVLPPPLFYPWPSEYNCSLLLTPHCFIRDHLCTTAAYCCFCTVLSVTICVQLLLIADSAQFPPWSSACNFRVLLTPFCFSVTIGVVQLPLFADCTFYPWPSLYKCCLSLTAHYLIPDRLYTTAAFRSLCTVLSVTIFIQLLFLADCTPFNPWSSVYDFWFSLTPYGFIRDSLCAVATLNCCWF